MAFVIKSKTEGFFYGIQIPVITDAGGSQINKFEFKFKRLTRNDINKLQRQQDAMNDSDFEVDSLVRDTDYIMEIAEGWRYVTDEAGKEVPFTRENVMLLLDAYPNAAGEIVKTFFECTLGGGAKRKNS